ncbi:MAG: BsuPI-related putative proteinase inhibitor [Gemmatimonadaceae bacterium]
MNSPTTDTGPTASREEALATSLNVTVKDGVTLAFHVTNTSSQQVELNFHSGQTYDFVVIDSAGKELWRWSEERMFTQALQNKLLRPRETLTFEEKWASPPRSGTFTAVGSLTSNNHPVSERVSFTLP